jgi:GNAT superfamily N-acetyltransferase
MSDFRVRLARPADAATILHHRYAMFVAMGGDPEETRRAVYEVNHDAWLLPKIEGGTYIGWLAENDAGEVVAGVGLWLMEWIPGPNAPNAVTGYLCNVFTEQAYRGQGLARQMLGMALDECRQRKIRRVALHASEGGRPLYESMGFKSTNEMRLEF